MKETVTMNSDAKDLQVKLDLPPIHQVGLLTRDMDKIVETYTSLLGLGPFQVYEFVPDKHWYKEEPTHFRAVYGKAMLGDIELCFMQPLEGKGLHMDYLEKKGEGLFNLGFHVSNYDETFDRFVKSGFKPVARAESFVQSYNGHLKGCYFDTEEACGMIFEIMWKSWV
jgi:hypothetical protein